MIVIDSSIVIAAVVADEPLHTRVYTQLTRWSIAGEQLIAPPLLYAEVTAVCRKLVVQQRFNQADGQHILAQMLSFPIETISHHAMYLRACELANLYALSRAYDTQYIALAEMQQCEFWTVDQRIVQTVSHQLPFVRWIGEEG